MIKCKSCGRENDDSFSFCLDCGGDLKSSPAGAATGTAPSAPATQPTPTAATTPSPTKESAAPATGATPTVDKPKPAPAMGTTPTAEKPKPAAPATGATPAADKPKPVAPSSPAPVEKAATAKPVATDTAICSKCGASVAAGNTFCSSCGNKMGEDAAKGSTMFIHVASPDAVKQVKARMVLIKPDGSEGTVFTVAAEKTALGRSQGIIMFPKDQYISPKHAELFFKEGKLTVKDIDSLNGIYFRIKDETSIYPGTYFRIGRQLLRLEVPGDFQALDIKTPEGDDSTFWGSPPPKVWARLVQVLEGGKIGEIHLLTQAEVIIGREDGEIRFPEDGFISSRHCLLRNKDGDCFIRDLGSSNGTYLRIRDSQELVNDDRIQIGNQVLKVDIS
ncbi:MAG: FHA domain-containing protein [Deltaproteobacteria bacterium]|nr:FHA domain-containing protein [Deltaproteobacteria bacterium]